MGNNRRPRPGPMEQMTPMKPCDPPRLAIVSTPRCGNTWLLHALQLLYDMPGAPISTPSELDWPRLPPGFVFQLHWHPTSEFVALLAGHRFRVLALTRHPLDCLISVLHFSLHDRTEHWLEGESGDERSIFAAMPRSTAFLDYASGPRAAALLSVSEEWKARPGTYVLRYENMVRDTAGELRRLADAVGATLRRPIEEVAAATTLQGMRDRTNPSRHFWMGQPGLWRRLLPAPEAQRIHAAHADLFASWDYPCDPDVDLSGSAADAAWTALSRNNLGQDLADLPRLRRELRDEREKARFAAAAAAAELATTRDELTRSRQRAVEEETRANEAEALAGALYRELEDLQRLGPVALGLARGFHSASVRFPNARAMLRQLLLASGHRSSPRHGRREGARGSH